MLRHGVRLPIGGPKQRALLALLLLNANEVVSRAHAIDFLWGEQPPERAVNALQVRVHGLRKSLGPARVLTRGSGYVLRADPDELDLIRFRKLYEEGRDALEGGDAVGAAAQLDEALCLWRGEALADLSLESANSFELTGLEELRLSANESRIEAELALGRQDGVIAELEALVAEHPFRERPRAQLMLALYRAGRQADALNAYQAARTTLGEELGIDPTPSLRELERAILRQDPSLRLPHLAVGTNLPRPATRLVGRRLEVASIGSLLRDPDVRLLTLSGPGGIGKTRLAIEAAAELAPEFEHGIAFVDLAPIADPALVEPTVAAAVDVNNDPQLTTRQQLVARLRGRELLLVLDNFERLLPAAPLVAELLVAAPRLRVLTTSRTLLHITAEHDYPVPPLAVPPQSDDLDALARNDSVSVFVARARAVERAFTLTDANAEAVAAICRRLEGLPLALELAAARVNVLTPGQILERLAEPLQLLTGGGRDLPERQQTLRATIDWSYQLLDQSQQVLFARLSAFAGGSTLEAIEQICEANLESLAGLLDNSLLRREQDTGREPRYRMLETVREYADQQLAAEDGNEVRRRHREYYATLAQRLGHDLVGKRSQVAVDHLAREHQNLRAALAYSLEADLEPGFRLAAALRPYWDTAARGHEIRIWLEQAFASNRSPQTLAQIGALVVLGRQRMNEGDYDESRTAFEAALAGAHELNTASDGAIALANLAWLSAAVGDYQRCLRLAEEAVDRARQGGNPLAERQGLAMIAGALINLGEYDSARPYLARSLALAQTLQDTNVIVLAMVNSGYGAICADELSEARSLLEQALTLCHQPELPVQVVPVLQLLAWEANLSGDHLRANAYLRRALTLLRTGGQLIHRIDVLGETAITLQITAPRAAAQLLGTVEANHSKRGLQTSTPMVKRYNPLRTQLTKTLDPDELATALAQGKQLELDDAIEEALAALHK